MCGDGKSYLDSDVGRSLVKEELMRKFLMGLVLGLLGGIAGTVLAFHGEERMTDQLLPGWRVIVDDETVCRNPFLWVSLMQIKCRAL